MGTSINILKEGGLQPSKTILNMSGSRGERGRGVSKSMRKYTPPILMGGRGSKRSGVFMDVTDSPSN